MVNKINIHNHQATGWDHYRKKNPERNDLKVSNYSKNKQQKNPVMSWLIDTLNPLNHIPIVSSVKNMVTKASTSIDIVQSAIGGLIYGGPIGILKGVGGWAINKIITTSKEAKVNQEKKLELPVNHKSDNKKKIPEDYSEVIDLI